MKVKLFFYLVLIFCVSAAKAQYSACTQIEDLTIPVGSKWIKKNSVSGFSGTGFVEWNGGNKFSGVPPVADVLVFTFTVPEDGIYTIMFRGRRQKGEGGCPIDAAGDGCNDIKTKINTGEWHKTMIKSTFGQWIWDAAVEIEGSGIRPREHVFKAGEIQTLYITGRSAGVQLDGVVVVPIAGFVVPRIYPADFNLKLDCLAVSPPKPTDCWKKSYNEGWNLARPDGYLASVTADLVSGANSINTFVQPKDQWAAAKITYEGNSGLTNIYLTTLLETDGECSFRVFVDGIKVLEFINPRITVADRAEYNPYTVEIKGVNVQQGSVIQVDSKSNSNGLIPEGTTGGFAWARGRWRSLSIGACSATVVNKSLGTLGVNTVQMASDIKIYPNPASGLVNFSETVDVEFYNSLGQKVLSVKNNDKADVSILKDGVYQVKVNNKFVSKLMIVK